MAAGEGPLGEDHVVAFPPAPTAEMLGVLIPEGKVDEFRRLERENRVRIWSVRGVVSDHIPLCGDSLSVLARASQHNLFVKDGELVRQLAMIDPCFLALFNPFLDIGFDDRILYNRALVQAPVLDTSLKRLRLRRVVVSGKERCFHKAIDLPFRFTL